MPGMIVLCSFISPFRAERRMVRELVGGEEFIEVFVDTPIEECMRRDPKGLYARAKAGQIKNFTGIDSPYEAPEARGNRRADARCQRRRGGPADSRDPARAADHRLACAQSLRHQANTGRRVVNFLVRNTKLVLTERTERSCSKWVLRNLS